MDAFNLKKDNRKKFQDKQKLKRRHATQSDLKYRKLNKQQEQEKKEEDGGAEAEEEAEEPLPSNEDRYATDVLYVAPEQDVQLQETSNAANKLIKKKLLSSVSKEESLEDTLQSLKISGNNIKSKDLMNMDIGSLNKMIGQHDMEELPVKHPQRDPFPKADTITKNKMDIFTRTLPKEKNVAQKVVPPSLVPDDLKDEEDFLDQFL